MFTFLSQNTPIIIIILTIIFVLLIIKKILLSQPPIELLTANFTINQLHQFNGVKKPQRFISLKNTIYDVTNSWFYRAGPYAKFLGHDISINLAKMSHDQSIYDKWGTYTLTNEQQKQLQSWVQKISNKYRKVGLLIQH